MNLTFPERLGFTRDEANDFADDGNFFRMYKYKGVLPFSALHAYGEVYVSPRDPMNRDGNRITLWNDRELDADRFNGIPEESWNVRRFAELCEEICIKYNLIDKTSDLNINAVGNYKIRDFENVTKMIDYYNNGSSLRRVVNALKSPASRDKFIDRFYIARYIGWGVFEDWTDVGRDAHGLTTDDLYAIEALATLDRCNDVYNIFPSLIEQ